MRYFLIAGEASGDLHAAHLITALRQRDAAAEFCLIGGDLMGKAAGVTPVLHYRDLAFMGFIPVLLHLPTILRGMRRCKAAIRDFRPDRLILVDYPGFNLSIAKYVHAQRLCPVCYYISPKIWAWKEYRIRALRRDVDCLLSILPFEVEWFGQRHGYAVQYVGNPTLDEVTAFRTDYAEERSDFVARHGGDTRKPVVALLAGSRSHEIARNLPLMLDAVAAVGSGCNVFIAGAPGTSAEVYAPYVAAHPEVRVVHGETFALLSHATAALVTSGTATLETALFGVPQVVCYATALPHLLRWARRHVLSVQHISLVNLIAGREVVPELVAADCTRGRIAAALSPLLADTAVRRAQLEGYGEMRRRLGAVGAPAVAAQHIIACSQRQA